MHQAKVRDPVTEVDVEPGVHNNGHTLENDKDDGQEAVDCVKDVQTVGMEVNDEVGDELQEVIDEGANAKDKSPLSQEATPVWLDIVKTCWGPGKMKQQIEKEYAGTKI